MQLKTQNGITRILDINESDPSVLIVENLTNKVCIYRNKIEAFFKHALQKAQILDSSG